MAVDNLVQFRNIVVIVQVGRAYRSVTSDHLFFLAGSRRFLPGAWFLCIYPVNPGSCNPAGSELGAISPDMGPPLLLLPGRLVSTTPMVGRRLLVIQLYLSRVAEFHH